MFKKLVSVIMTVIIICILGFPAPAFASTVPALTISNKSARAGSEIVVSVDITPDSNVALIQFEINYDAEKLELLNVTEGQVLPSPSFSFNDEQQRVNLAWDALNAVTQGGTILYITFLVKDTAEGKADIWFNEEEDFIFADQNMIDLGCSKIPGAVSILDVPVTPSAAAVSSSYNSINISWNAVEGASGYEVYRSMDPDKEYCEIFDTSAPSILSYTNIGLTTGQAYYYRIRAYNSEPRVYSDFSDPASATPVPSAPSIIPASTSFTAIKVSWTAVAGASGYEVWYGTQKNGTYSLKYTSNSGAAGSWTKSGLTTDKAYYFKVRAFRTVNGVKVYGPDSSIASTAPGRVTMAVARASSTSAKITWVALSGAAGYEVWRGTTKNGTYSLKYTAKPTVTSWTNTSLITGKAYYYQVRTWRMLSGKKVYGQFSPINSIVP